MDKQAVQTSIEILATAERPLVIFPEGHVSRTNDRLTPTLAGTALIARQAAKRRAKENKKVVVLAPTTTACTEAPGTMVITGGVTAHFDSPRATST